MGLIAIIGYISVTIYMIVFGVCLYIAMLVIKALKVYINKNS